MAEKIIKGKDLMLFDNQGHSFAYATNHTFSMTAETADTSSKDHGIWSSAEVTKYSWEITSENLYTEVDYDSMYDAMIEGEAIQIRFGLKVQPSNPADNVVDGDLDYWSAQSSYLEGKAIITSLVANAPNGDNATYSVTLTGVGSIKRHGGSSN